MKDAARVFGVLSDPCRLQILGSLAKRKGCVSELQIATGRSQPNISQHLRVLRDSGLVATKREGKKICYSLAGIRVKQLLDAVNSIGR